MIKKRFLSIFFAFILGFTAFLFVACNQKENFCILSFENYSYNLDIQQDNLPKINNKKVKTNSPFDGVECYGDYCPVEYRVYKTDGFYQNLYKNQVITQNTHVVIVWEYKAQNEESQEFKNLINKINKLEEISSNYNQEKKVDSNVQIRVMQYIRQQRYNSSQWNTFGGTIENDFSDYVLQNQGEFDLSSLQSLPTFTIVKTGEQVDFVHMIAVMNVFAYGNLENNTINDLVGWGGDLCQLTLELKNQNINDDSLQTTALSLFNNNSSSFSNQDLTSDLDAINIIDIYNSLAKDKKSISSAIKEYYKSINKDQRKQNFLLKIFPDVINKENGLTILSTKQMAEKVLNRLQSSLFIRYWCVQNNLNFTNDAKYFSACANAFSKYFIEK